MSHVNELDRRVLSAMSGAERIRMLLREAGFRTLSDFSFEIRQHVQAISYCINGEREYPEIREALAKHLCVTRQEIDRLIESQVAA